MITDYKNKRIAVLGAGTEGLASLEWLRKQGADVTVLDIKEIGNDIRKRGYKDIKIITGESYLDNLEQYDMIVRSPGIKRTLPQLIDAEKKGVKITSHTIMFFEESPAPIIGVTGTKGKGTTSTLIYEMLKAERLDVHLGGNIGVPPLTFLEKLHPSSWVVLELSSFQLEDLKKSPHIAVILMITSDHLQYHEDLMAYVDAKRNILRWQGPNDYAVINRDYPASHESDIHTDGQVFQVSTESIVERGCFVDKRKIFLRKFDQNQMVKFQEQTEIQNENYPQDIVQNTEEEIVDTEDILIPGRHNWENVCAAVMAASLAGVSKKSIVQAIKTFKGLEHRLELVRTVRGVLYYDDSIATNPESALAGIQAFKQPKILILGGVTEGSDFEQLGTYISLDPSIKAIIGIGKEWPTIKLKIQNSKFKIIEDCKNMQEVVNAAAEVAEAGDVVLLSPACKSFDMFTSYKDRGEQFKKAVHAL